MNIHCSIDLYEWAFHIFVDTTSIKGLYGADILLGNGNQLNFTSYRKCGSVKAQHYTNYQTLFIKCTDGPIEAAYVAVMGAASGRALKLCEVQVFLDSHGKYRA